MFGKRSTSPPPAVSHSHSQAVETAHNSKPFNDWKRRVGQKTLLKLGLTNDIKDENTGNFDAHVDRFHANSAKVSTMKNECEGFCSHFRIFLQLGFDNLTFLTDSEVDDLYNEMATNQLAPVVEYILCNEIERPINFLAAKTREIEHLIKHRNEVLLLDYQHHMRKLELLQEKAVSHRKESLQEDIHARQVKVESSAERLKDGNQFLEASISAYDYTYARVRKKVLAAMCGVHAYLGQQLLAAYNGAVRGHSSNEVTAVLDMMIAYRIVLQERRALIVNTTADAASAVAANHGRSHLLATTVTPTGRASPPPSSHGAGRATSPPPQGKSSLTHSTTPVVVHPNGSGNSAGAGAASSSRRPSASAAAGQTIRRLSASGGDAGHSAFPAAYAFSGQDEADSPYELEDYTYALNLHLGEVGEVFGRSLDEFSHTVPVVVVECLLLLEHNGLDTEGVFRISGDDAAIMDLRRSYDDGLDNFEWRVKSDVSESEVHNAASLLKLYFRTLPEPLIPRKCYRPLTDAIKLPADEFVSRAKSIIHPPDVTPLNVRVIAHLFRLLHMLTTHSHVNRMTKENIAIVFAPSLLLPEAAQELGLFELQNGIGIVRLLVEHAVEIFQEAWDIHPLE